MLYDITKFLNQAPICIRVGIFLAIKDANSPEGLGVRPTEREAEVGNHIELNVRIVLPMRVCECVGDQQRFLTIDNSFAIKT